MSGLFQRQTSGSVVCPSCGKLVGVNDAACWSCGRRNPGLWGFGKALRSLGGELAVSQVVLWGCGALYLLSLVLDPSGVRMEGTLSFLSPSGRALGLLGSSGAVPIVLQGKWWTLLSAGWLHGGLLHIGFNMLWVRQLAPAASSIYGSGRTMLLYIGSSVVGFALSSLGGAYLPFLGPLMGRAFFTVGASAAIFGLLGALVYAGRRGVAPVGRQAWVYAIVLFLFGLVMPGVDNWAHLGGFLGGYGLAAWFNPLKPERADHLLLALGALVLTGGAVLLSLLSGLGG